LTCIDLLSDGSQLRSVSVWDFEENANAAAASIREPATWETAGMLAAAPTTTIGEVIDSSVRWSVAIGDAASHRVRGDRYPNPRCCRTAQGPPKAVIMDVGSFLGAGVRWCGGGGLCAAGCASGFCWSPRVWR